MYRYIVVLAALAVLHFAAPAMARDFGSAADVQQIKAVVTAQFGVCANVAVSHEWAMCLANSEDSDITVLLHRVGGRWKVVAHDGGAYVKAVLETKGVPASDIPVLLKTYQ